MEGFHDGNDIRLTAPAIRRRRCLSGSGSKRITVDRQNAGWRPSLCKPLTLQPDCGEEGTEAFAHGGGLRYITMALVAPSREYLGRVFLSSQWEMRGRGTPLPHPASTENCSLAGIHHCRGRVPRPGGKMLGFRICFGESVIGRLWDGFPGPCAPVI